MSLIKVDFEGEEMEIGDKLYIVDYSVTADMEFTPEVIGRLPEDCSPSESSYESQTPVITAVQDEDGEAVEVTEELRAVLLTKIDSAVVEEVLWDEYHSETEDPEDPEDYESDED